MRVALFALVATILLTSCGGGDDGPNPTVSPAPSASGLPGPSDSVASPTSAPVAGELEDGSFMSSQPDLKADSLRGTFDGTARITNTSSKTLTGTFIYTLLVDDKVVGTIRAFAADVEPGKTVTVELSTNDKYMPGFRVEFQTDAEIE